MVLINTSSVILWNRIFKNTKGIGHSQIFEFHRFVYPEVMLSSFSYSQR